MFPLLLWAPAAAGRAGRALDPGRVAGALAAWSVWLIQSGLAAAFICRSRVPGSPGWAALPRGSVARAPGRWLAEGGAGLGLIAIVVPAVLLDSYVLFPGLSAIPACLGAALHHSCRRRPDDRGGAPAVLAADPACRADLIFLVPVALAADFLASYLYACRRGSGGESASCSLSDRRSWLGSPGAMSSGRSAGMPTRAQDRANPRHLGRAPSRRSCWLPERFHGSAPCAGTSRPSVDRAQAVCYDYDRLRCRSVSASCPRKLSLGDLDQAACLQIKPGKEEYPAGSATAMPPISAPVSKTTVLPSTSCRQHFPVVCRPCRARAQRTAARCGSTSSRSSCRRTKWTRSS